MIYQTVAFNDFRDAFQKIRPDNFSYAGQRALFDYLEDLSETLEYDIDLDVIALCCKFSEYADLEEIQENYDDIESLDDLRDNTTVIDFDGGIIIATNF